MWTWKIFQLQSNVVHHVLKQKWFIMKFLGKGDEINVKTKNPEFFDWKWIELSKLPNVAVHFKVDIYKKIKEELTSLSLN